MKRKGTRTRKKNKPQFSFELINKVFGELASINKSPLRLKEATRQTDSVE